MDKLAVLREMPLFEDINPEILAPLADYFITKRFERGDRIWREGAKATSFTFVVEGRIKIVKFRNDGRETILGVFGEDDAVGHLAVYQEIPYPASAYALDDTIILEIHRNHFYGTIRSHEKLLEAVLRNMMQRNHDLVKRVHDLSVCSAEQRLALLFEKFSESAGKRIKLEDGTWGVFIDMPLTRNDISNLINTRVETAIRMMSNWNKNGPVRTEKHGFIVTDPEKLKALASDCP